MEQIRVTEQASAYDDLQRMSVHDLLTGINREDRRVADAVAATIPTMERLVERIVERMQRGGRMFYIGAGTSGRLAVTDASELPPTYGVPFDTVIGLIAGGDGALRKAVEHAEDDTEGAWRDMQPWRPDGGDILIGVAASGTTPYVVGGLRTARAHGLLTGAITCNPRSPVAAEAEYALEAVVGPEFVTCRHQMAHLLQKESELMEIVKLIGADILPEDQKLIIETAKLFRVGFLQQNAYHAIDTYVPLDKQLRMMELMLKLYSGAKDIVSRAIPLSQLKETGIFESLAKMKYEVPNDGQEKFAEYDAAIEDALRQVNEANR